MPYDKQPLATSEGKLTGLSKELLQLQEEMNNALEELLEIKATMDYHHREPDIGAELAACLNDAQLAEAKTCHAATATTLQRVHLDSVSALNCNTIAQEG